MSSSPSASCDATTGRRYDTISNARQEEDELQQLQNYIMNPREVATERTSSSSSTASVIMVAATVGTMGGILALTLPFVVLPSVFGQTLPYMATPSSKVQKALNFLVQRQRQQQRHRHTTTRAAIVSNRTAVATNDHHSASSPSNSSRRSFLDLGSGDGETVFQAVQLLRGDEDSLPSSTATPTTTPVPCQYYYYTNCVGVELNATLFLISALRRAFFWSHSQRQRSRFYCRDVFYLPDAMIQEADTIFLFGIPSLMTSFSEHLARQGLRPGTHILSYRFPLPIERVFVEGDDDGDDTTIPHHRGPQRLLRAELIYHEDEMHIYECLAMSDDEMVSDAEANVTPTVT